MLQFADQADLQNIAADQTNYGLYLADLAIIIIIIMFIKQSWQNVATIT